MTYSSRRHLTRFYSIFSLKSINKNYLLHLFKYILCCLRLSLNRWRYTKKFDASKICKHIVQYYRYTGSCPGTRLLFQNDYFQKIMHGPPSPPSIIVFRQRENLSHLSSRIHSRVQSFESIKDPCLFIYLFVVVNAAAIHDYCFMANSRNPHNNNNLLETFRLPEKKK